MFRIIKQNSCYTNYVCRNCCVSSFLPTREGTKPVIIRFLGRRRRDGSISKRNKFNEIDLSDHGIRKLYVNENLSPFMKNLAYHCRKLKTIE